MKEIIGTVLLGGMVAGVMGYIVNDVVQVYKVIRYNMKNECEVDD